jgi:pimeloyl-ACP methyl ester carboxylesterase
MIHFTTTTNFMPEHAGACMDPERVTEKAIGIKIEGYGPDIVLLHSSLSSKSQWRSLMDCMRDTHRLIAIDLHGYGDNVLPTCRDHYSLIDEVRLVESKLASVLAPGQRFHLVGHSFGGGVALRLAHAHREQIRSLSLYEPTAFHLLNRGDPALAEVQAVAAALEDALQHGLTHSATEIFIDFWNSIGAYVALPTSRRSLFASLIPKVPLDFHALLNDPMRPDDYRHMTAPTCLIAGRHSPDCTRAIASILATSLAHRETHEIDASHMAPLTHPALVNSLIDGFIRRIAQPC